MSSGLVAVAYLNTNSVDGRSVLTLAPITGHYAMLWQNAPLVRLSDAEAIISEKDAEIERLKESVAAFKQTIFTNTNRELTLKDRFFTAHEGGFISDNNFDFDAGLQVGGDFADDEKNRYGRMIACTLNDYAKQAERIKELEDDRDTWKARAEFSFTQRDKQSAALKLAKAALERFGGFRGVNQALAAIDALGE